MTATITNAAFWQSRLVKAQTQLGEIEDAIEALTIGGLSQYTMNTGQGVVTVTKLNLRSMQESVDVLLNRITGIENRICGSNVTIARAAW